eukprot:gene5254-7302_t
MNIRYSLYAKTLSLSIVGCVSFGAYQAWRVRPIPDPMINTDGPKRNELGLAKHSKADNADGDDILYDIFSSLVTLLTVSVSRAYAIYGGEFKLITDENYNQFLCYVLGNKSKNRPIITVSNHRCVMDDITVHSSILPYWCNIQPKYLRYSLCAQEYCFNEKLPAFVHTYMGAGKVLPIWRGGGINQKLLLDYARLIAAGGWCHIYPEGGVWQLSELGGRTNYSKLGKLKWGVGKLIAHSPVKPIVIPFFFSGTETMIPQDPITKKVSSWIPNFGHKVTVRFGIELDFTDLINEHELKYGPLWKYKPSIKYEMNENYHDYWDSKPEDLILYNKITNRIEEALVNLNEQSNKELS